MLCGGQVRARNLLELLETRRIPAVLDLRGALPSAERGTHYAGYSVRRVRVPGPAAGGADGGPADHAAGRQVKKARPKRDSNQQKLQSYADLTPGDLVVHQHHGIGRFVG